MIALSHIFVGKVKLPLDDGKKQIDPALVHFLTIENSARRILNRISTNALPELNVRGFRSVMRCYKVAIHNILDLVLNQNQHAPNLPTMARSSVIQIKFIIIIIIIIINELLDCWANHFQSLGSSQCDSNASLPPIQKLKF